MHAYLQHNKVTVARSEWPQTPNEHTCHFPLFVNKIQFSRNATSFSYLMGGEQQQKKVSGPSKLHQNITIQKPH